MNQTKELIALPSKVILQSGKAIELDKLKKDLRSEIQKSICNNLSKNLSNYYSSNHKEWENFISIMA